jgi:isorenieratene synthase
MTTGWVVLLLILYGAWWLARKGWLTRALRRAIQRRLGGYLQQAETIDLTRPRVVSDQAPRVAVLGGGLAGIGAAATLGERGVDVTLFEANEYLGGKIGAWKVAVGDGTQTVEHGFHAFFRQYYNLNRFLDRLGVRTRGLPRSRTI